MAKKTACYARHIDLGAKMVEYAGYEMPLKYTKQIDEHKAVRNNVGIFDVSHMGEFVISGDGATDLVQWITTNDVTTLAIGQAQYTCMTQADGGIIDDMIVYKLDESQYLLVVNAANIEKDWNWISSQNTFGAHMINRSAEMSLIALQGPKASAVLSQLTALAIAEISFYHFAIGEVAGIDEVIVSATGYTGEKGYELYVSNSHASQLWQALMDKGEAFGIQPCGLAARDSLRLEMGYCLYGNDIDETTTPIEAGLSWITKWTHPFVGQPALALQKKAGVDRRLVGVVMLDKGIPRQGYAVLDTEGQAIGKVTSGTQSPMLEQGVALAYVKTGYHKKETPVFIQIRNKSYPAKVVRPPFYKK